MWKSQDQIETGAHAGGEAHRHCGARLLCAVNAADRGELAIIERLHADRDAVDAEVAPRGERFWRDVFGIGFDGELTPALECGRRRAGRTRASAPPEFIRDAAQVLDRRSRRCAAAEVDRLDLPAVQLRTDLANERVRVCVLLRQVRRDRERTVCAVHATERKMNVDTVPTNGHAVRNVLYNHENVRIRPTPTTSLDAPRRHEIG